MTTILAHGAASNHCSLGEQRSNVSSSEFLSIREVSMLPENRIPTHPGEILLEEFLVPLEMSQVAFACHIRVPLQRIKDFCQVKTIVAKLYRMRYN
jgi:hypothetical protein